MFNAFMGLAFGAAIGAVASYAVLDPQGKSNHLQRALLNEYVRVYCTPNFTNQDSAFLAGNAALISRLIVSADLGALAMAEYAKCRIWVP